MKKQDFHAKLVVYDLPKLNREDLKRLSTWLAKLSMELKKDAKEYDILFTAKLMR